MPSTAIAACTADSIDAPTRRVHRTAHADPPGGHARHRLLARPRDEVPEPRAVLDRGAGSRARGAHPRPRHASEGGAPPRPRGGRRLRARPDRLLGDVIPVRPGAWDGAFYFDRSFDVAETTRGCPLPCTFCSIRRMYGRTFRRFPIRRVIEDLRALDRRGVGGVFFVDDNITIDVPRFKELCDEIPRAGLAHLRYIVQASVHGIAKDATLAPKMARAGFDTVFMGIENAEAANVAALDIAPKRGRTEDETPRAVRLLQENGIKAAGGFIVGNPDDDPAAIARTFDYARRLGLDFPIVQCLTPYPRTEMRADLLAEGLVTNPDDLSRYNGYMANVRTRHLSSSTIARTMLWESLKLYFDPRAARRSRFFHDFPGFRGAMLRNNLALFSAARNRIDRKSVG